MEGQAETIGLQAGRSVWKTRPAAARCATENVDHLGFLLQLCEWELIQHEKRAAERRLMAARFPNPKTLEDFQFEAQPSLYRVLVGELLRGEYIDHRESVILVGNPGTDKTHLATVLGRAACGHGKRVRFWRVTELITHLMEVREEHQLTRMKNQLLWLPACGKPMIRPRRN